MYPSPRGDTITVTNDEPLSENPVNEYGEQHSCISQGSREMQPSTCAMAVLLRQSGIVHAATYNPLVDGCVPLAKGVMFLLQFCW